LGRASRARRIATTAIYGGGGLGLAGAALAGLLFGEVKLAHRWVGPPEGEAPRPDEWWGDGNGDPVTLAVLGDSSAAGLGASHGAETPAVLVAAGLAEVAERPVRLINVAVVGAQSSQLGPQVEQAVVHRPEIALIMIGANDVTHRVRPAQAVRSLAEAVHGLREGGAEVVVATCPDLGTIEPIAQPLRWIVRAWSRNLAAAQTIATVEAGGRTVSMSDVLGGEFAARPSEMFSADRFHPSAEGYAAAAAVMLPTVCAALGLWPEEAVRPHRPFSHEGVRPIAKAAARAAGHAGTEVAGAEVDGHERGPRGRWAFLRRRPRQPLPVPLSDDDGDETTGRVRARENDPPTDEHLPRVGRNL
jgi:lysophospholipase L1-like esterase